MKLPQFDCDSHILFIGNISLYLPLKQSWDKDAGLLTVVARLDFAKRLLEESYFTDCIIDLDTCCHQDLKWYLCPQDISSHAIASEKRSLVLSQDIKEKFTEIYFFDENYDYNFRGKDAYFEDSFYQNKKFYQTRRFRYYRSKILKTIYRIAILGFVLFALVFTVAFMINLMESSQVDTKQGDQKLSTKITDSFYKSIESMEKMVAPKQERSRVEKFSFSGDWDLMFERTESMSNDDLLNIRNSLPDDTLQYIKNRLSPEQKNALRKRFR
ncbi:hypothetical protein MJH12_12295 [bacterium]|nr:hypothetical protein [bacterium]